MRATLVRAHARNNQIWQNLNVIPPQPPATAPPASAPPASALPASAPPAPAPPAPAFTAPTRFDGNQGAVSGEPHVENASEHILGGGVQNSIPAQPSSSLSPEVANQVPLNSGMANSELNQLNPRST